MFKQKVVLVTGASGGIGEVTARLFADRGWAVILAARSEDKLRRIAAELEHRGWTALVVPTDVTEPKARERLVAAALERFGRIDVLINNAGSGMIGTVETLELDAFDYLLQLNVVAPLALTQAVIPAMRRQGGGVIVNVSSLAECIPAPYVGGYCASKAALAQLTGAASAELVRDNIAVVKVKPGVTATDFDRNALQAGAGLSFDALLAQANFMTPIPPERVAADIWRAVRTRKSRPCPTLRDRLLCLMARVAPRAMNEALKFAVKRYVRPDGEPSDADIRSDLKTLAWAVGGLVATITGFATALGMWLRRRRQSQGTTN